jgi:hypothetical protein
MMLLNEPATLVSYLSIGLTLISLGQWGTKNGSWRVWMMVSMTFRKQPSHPSIPFIIIANRSLAQIILTFVFIVLLLVVERDQT